MYAPFTKQNVMMVVTHSFVDISVWDRLRKVADLSYQDVPEARPSSVSLPLRKSTLEDTMSPIINASTSDHC